MAFITISKMSFKGIGKFVTEQTINFETKGAITQLDGINHSTGGSSGSGKSTIFKALDYCFGINNLPATVLQSRHTKTPIEVTVEGFLDNKPFVLSRGKNIGLTLTIDGVPVEGHTTLVETKLDELIGMPREIFGKLLHKKQRDGGFFSNLTPKQSHEFVSKASGMEDYLKKISKISLDIKALHEKKQQTETMLVGANSKLESLNTVKSTLKEPVCYASKPDETLGDVFKYEESISILLNEQSAAIRKAETELASQPEESQPVPPEGLDERKNRLVNLERESATKIAEHKAFLASISQDITSKKKDLLKYDKIRKEISNNNNKIEEIKRQILSLRASKCYTCDQPWHTDGKMQEKQAEAMALFEEKQALEKSLCAEEDDIKAVQQLELSLSEQSSVTISVSPEIQEVKNQIADMERLYEMNKSFCKREYFDRLSQAKENLNKAKNLHADTIRDYQSKMHDIKSRIKNYEDALASYEKNKLQYQTQMTTIQSEIDGCVSQIKKLQDDVLDIKNNIEVAEESARFIKSFMNQRFQNTLAMVASYANDILASIPNTASTTVSFAPYKETKEGKIKEEVVIEVSKDGEVGIPIASLSGGERTSLDLAIDLSVMKMVQSMMGSGVNMLILDEPFDGLDSVSKEQYVEILKQNSDISKKIIIVDHNPETKQHVQNVILVKGYDTYSEVIDI